MSAGSSPLKSMVVLTVDDHPLIRSALREVLCSMAERIELIEASNPEEGLELLGSRLDTDLIFLDLSFSRHDGLAFVEKFRSAAAAAPLIIYTMHEDAPTLKQALACGAVGIIPKTHSKKLLQSAIEVVMAGGVYLPPELTRQLASLDASPPGRAPAAKGLQAVMSEQQWNILELLAEGLPNKEIARKLGIAPSTVKNQLTVVFDRMGVSNRTQAAISARTLLRSSRKGRTGGS